MGTHVTRRGVLLLLGGTLASAMAVWTCGTPSTERATVIPAEEAVGDDGAAGYVDREGWMLTAADHEKLGTRRIATADTPEEP
jgi:hypothetical protein